jgi:predicted ATP-binding protein involved in virulence
MKTTSLVVSALMILSATGVFAQSKTTEAIQKEYNARPFFAYHNTLRMLNQKEDKAFDEMIENIEKMKLLMIKKPAGFSTANYKKIVGDYAKDGFDVGMTSRYEGKTLDVYLKEKEGKVKSVLVLVNDVETLYVLDIVGSLALDKIGSLYKTIESSKEFEDVFSNFTREHKKDEDDDDQKDKDDN